MQPVQASDVARLAGDDHKLRAALDEALRRCGYHYDINNDWFVKKPVQGV